MDGGGFQFTVPGVPKGQGRPRFRTITPIGAKPFSMAYDPKESRNWKQVVQETARHAGVQQIAGPVRLVVTAYMPRPKRLCRKKDPQHALPALCKPDFDNIAKGVADALIGVAYADDSAVVDGRCLKMYHEIGGMPRTEVMVFAARIERQ